MTGTDWIFWLAILALGIASVVDVIRSRQRPAPLPNYFRGAYSAGALGLFFLWAGAAGYQVSRGARFHAGAWSGDVIWWQVWVGLVLCPVAVYLWRRAMRS